MGTGWLSDADGWHFLGEGGAALSGWAYLGGSWFYFDPAGRGCPALSGFFEVNGERFFADSEGRLLVERWVDMGNGFFSFADSRGTLSGLATCAADGSMCLQGASGLVTLGSSRLYCEAVTGKVLTGWQSVDGKWFFFDPSRGGAAATGWVQPYGRQWYHLADDCSMDIGWLQLGSAWYYLYPDSGVMATGWVQPYGRQWYYLQDNGAMATGWLRLGSSYYYLYPDSGVMATGWVTIGGIVYLFEDNGVCSSSQMEMIFKAQSFWSPTSYLILVNTSSNYVGVFSGSQGRWDLVYYWQCSSGASATPTVQGEFSIGIRGTYFNSGNARCWWFTQFYGNYLFHSVLYYPSGVLMDGRLGMNLSHGCVRLDIDNAKWIYDNIPSQTKVYVY